MERDLFNSGYGELVSVLQLSGEIRGRARDRNPDASHCASSPNISSSAKAGDLFPGGHYPLEHCPKRCFKVEGMDVRISLFGLSLTSPYVCFYISEHIL